MTRLPRHIAIIMDGNGRWAKRRGLGRKAGHAAGAETLREIADYCSDIGIEVLTAYAFSTENWKRPKEEVDALMDLLYDYLCDADKKLVGRNNKVRVIGNREPLRKDIQEKMAEVEKMTENNTGMVLNLAVNYGGREEITQATSRIAADVASGKIDAGSIDEKLLADYMYTAGLPDPDIIMRPSGELRLSNFLLWQAAYSEFWFADMCWPDFTPKHIKRVIYDFQKRDRRFGKV
ncbi:MAG: isoprenyl transferase [Clostridia bacterium]|nr:isoprenyl transferase [Clostridia bacterium]